MDVFSRITTDTIKIKEIPVFLTPCVKLILRTQWGHSLHAMSFNINIRAGTIYSEPLHLNSTENDERGDFHMNRGFIYRKNNIYMSLSLSNPWLVRKFYELDKQIYSYISSKIQNFTTDMYIPMCSTENMHQTPTLRLRCCKNICIEYDDDDESNSATNSVEETIKCFANTCVYVSSIRLNFQNSKVWRIYDKETETFKYGCTMYIELLKNIMKCNNSVAVFSDIASLTGIQFQINNTNSK